MTISVLAVGLAQPLPSVMIRLYVPAFALVTFDSVGLTNVELKPFGPVHAYV